MRRTNFFALVSFVILVLFLAASSSVLAVKGSGGKIKPILKKGDYFPVISLQTQLDPQDSAYLGIEGSAQLKISDIKTDLVMVEVMSVFCGVCQKMADVFNEVYALVEADPEMKGKVKMVGISLGDIDSDVKAFREGLKVPYPIIPDPKSAAHAEIGNKYTPFTVFVRQGADGKPGLVVKTHETPNDNAKEIVEEIRAYIKMDISNIRKADNR
jgi:thiol-disulfide isomerase/thioredoxin